MIQWLAAWTLLIIALSLLASTGPGRVFVYYILWSSIVLLIVSHYQEITTIFQQGNITQGQY